MQIKEGERTHSVSEGSEVQEKNMERERGGEKETMSQTRGVRAVEQKPETIGELGIRQTLRRGTRQRNDVISLRQGMEHCRGRSGKKQIRCQLLLSDKRRSGPEANKLVTERDIDELR